MDHTQVPSHLGHQTQGHAPDHCMSCKDNWSLLDTPLPLYQSVWKVYHVINRNYNRDALFQYENDLIG